jgi:deferrochelatase/peroxidase EfeB
VSDVGRVTRRRLLAGGAVVGGAAVVGGVTAARSSDGQAAGSGSGVVGFRGVHQAGITTPSQDRVHFAAFDVVTDDPAELRALLDEWTAAAEQMTQGLEAGEFGAVGGPYLAPPDDTGEALGLSAARLTLTFGFGPTLFELDAVDRFGIADRRPSALQPLPTFAGDDLDPQRVGGDLCIQACADDPQVAFHAVRNLARIGFGRAAMRWSQLGFGRTSSTSTAQSTPRNLFGFKDGTANIKAEETAELDRHVWLQADDDGERWAGGSYVVARRIRMHIETWDRTPLSEQELLIGRQKGSGAPMTGGDEFAQPDFEMSDGNGGGPLIDMNAHVRLAHPADNNGVRILRRGFNFTDGTDALGRLDAGLLFIAYMRNPLTQFVPMQTKLAANDLLSEYLEATGSAVFVVPPGLLSGASLADALFG